MLFVSFLACGLTSPDRSAVDINTASQPELEAVKGLAKASVAKFRGEPAMGEAKEADRPKK